jgi:hypothetical protein
MKIKEMQNKGPLLDITKKCHIYNEQKQGNTPNERNITPSNGLLDLLFERGNAADKHCS